MFIICKNEDPILICPPETDESFALKIAEHLQEEIGLQTGLASSVYYFVHEIKLVSQQLIEQLKLENENGSEETN